MKPSSSVKELNGRLLLSMQQDGLPDLLGGMIVSTFGLIPILDQTGMNPGVRQVIIFSIYLLEILLVIWMKRRITAPRAGLVVVSRKVKSRISMIFLGVNLALLVFFGISYLSVGVPGTWVGQFRLSIPLGLIFLVLFTVLAALLRASRFYFFGITVLVTLLFFEYLFNRGMVSHHGIPTACLLSGGMIIFSGGFRLIRFVKTYSLHN